MPIYTPGPPERENIFLEEMPTTAGEALSAAARYAYQHSPLTHLMNAIKSAELEIEDTIVGGPGRVLTREEAAGIASKTGATPDIPPQGISERQLRFLIDIEQYDQALQSSMSRGPEGFLAGAGMLGASLLGSVLDPINIASAFIPVVGQARYASMVARATGGLGRAGVRARVGAVEGVAGAAILEPFVYAAENALYGDYDTADSLLNIGFGGLFGAALHTGAGAIADALKRGDLGNVRPAGPVAETISRAGIDERIEIGRQALSQVLQDQDVDIGPAFARIEAGQLGDIRDVANVETAAGVFRLRDDGTIERISSVEPELEKTEVVGFATKKRADEIGAVLESPGKGKTARIEEVRTEDGRVAYAAIVRDAKTGEVAQLHRIDLRRDTPDIGDMPVSRATSGEVGFGQPVITSEQLAVARTSPLTSESPQRAEIERAGKVSKAIVDERAMQAFDEDAAVAVARPEPKDIEQEISVAKEEESLAQVDADDIDALAEESADVKKIAKAVVEKADETIADAERLGKAMTALAKCQARG